MRTLARSILSVLENVPTCHLVFCDSGSTDGTKEYIRRVNTPKILAGDEPNLSRARKALIDSAHTELFAFVDSDVYLFDGWFQRLQPQIDAPSVGAVQCGVVNPRILEDYEVGITYVARAFKLKTSYERGRFRAFTGATLMRRDCVQGLRLPSLPYYEDVLIRRHVERNGFRWLRVPDKLCYHDFHYKTLWTHTYWNGISAAWAKDTSFLSVMARTFTQPPKAVASALVTGNIQSAKYRTSLQIAFTSGWVKGMTMHSPEIPQ